MNPSHRLRLLVLGASGSGRSRLVQDLGHTLAACGILSTGSEHAPAEALLCDDRPGLQALLTASPEKSPSQAQIAAQLEGFHLILLSGLDLPVQAATAALQQAQDARLRAALDLGGRAYQVVYGQGPDRARNALSALLRLPGSRSLSGFSALQQHLQDARDERVLNRPWRCEHCSDAGCEHRLFSALLHAPRPAH